MPERSSNNFVMTRLPWIVAAIAVIALIVTLTSVRNTGPSGTASGEESTQDLLARIEALENSRRGTGTASSIQRSANATGMGPAGGNSIDALSGQPQQTPEQMEAARKRELQELESAFARDKADPVRGGQVERTLEQTVTSETMAGTGLKPDDVAIDCRATTCRVVGQFAKRGDAEDWALFYVTAAGGNVFTQTRMAYVTRADGSTEVRVFATRARR